MLNEFLYIYTVESADTQPESAPDAKDKERTQVESAPAKLAAATLEKAPTAHNKKKLVLRLKKLNQKKNVLPGMANINIPPLQAPPYSGPSRSAADISNNPSEEDDDIVRLPPPPKPFKPVPPSKRRVKSSVNLNRNRNHLHLLIHHIVNRVNPNHLHLHLHLHLLLIHHIVNQDQMHLLLIHHIVNQNQMVK